MSSDHKAPQQWGIPFTQHGGVTLVDRRDAVACVTQIIRDGCRFHGYDAFALTADGIRPFLEFSSIGHVGKCPG